MKFRKVIHRLCWGITPKKWLSYGYLKQHTRSLRSLASSVLSNPALGKTANPAISFEQAMTRAGITESDLAAAMRQNLTAVKIFTSVCAFVFLYACYICTSYPIEALMVFMLSLLSLAYAWREHHNYIKLKYRKLFLTPKEWLKLAIK